MMKHLSPPAAAPGSPRPARHPALADYSPSDWQQYQLKGESSRQLGIVSPK